MDELSMRERIEDKINQINKYREELGTFMPVSFEEYSKDISKKAACERYIEKIAESAVDLAILFIRLKNLESPEDDDTSFFILAKNNVITDELSKKLSNLKGMRNRLAHQYEKVDDKLVFNAVDFEIEEDIENFIKCIERGVNKKQTGKYET